MVVDAIHYLLLFKVIANGIWRRSLNKRIFPGRKPSFSHGFVYRRDYLGQIPLSVFAAIKGAVEKKLATDAKIIDWTD